MPRHPVRALLVTVVGALALGACSEGGADVGSAEGADGARDVVVTLAGALPTGDGPRVCSLLAPAAQRRLEERWGQTSCLTAVRSSSEALGGRAKATLRGADEVRVRVDGEAATVSGRAAAVLARVLRQETLELVRVEEHWVVS